jgi:plastocyanin
MKKISILMGLVAIALLAMNQAELKAQQEMGTIKVTAKFEGTAPVAKSLNMNADPACTQANGGKKVKSQAVLVNPNGTLRNVLAYVNGPVAGAATPPSAAAKLDQKGCMYQPRVQSVMVGQQMEIKNSDTTLHNVHSYKGTATVFNRATFANFSFKHSFKENGEIIKFKCDVHPWMTGYVHVAENPFSGVTGSDGSVSIANVPAGTYTLKTWHEQYGAQTQEVTVKAGATAEVTSTFKAGA